LIQTSGNFNRNINLEIAYMLKHPYSFKSYLTFAPTCRYSHPPFGDEVSGRAGVIKIYLEIGKSAGKI